MKQFQVHERHSEGETCLYKHGKLGARIHLLEMRAMAEVQSGD